MSTTNYTFNLPTVGGSEDTWGTQLNANWVALDTQLFSGTIGADTTGNAATATLANAATTATSATALQTARTLTIGNTGKTFNGTAGVSWSLGEIGAQATLGFTPVTQGGGSFMSNNRIFLGWDGGVSAVRAQVDATQLGMVVTNRSGVDAAVSGSLFAPGTAPLYACRAWVHFNGSGGGIRASGNVSSVAQTNTGIYIVNFATSMPDGNFAASGSVNYLFQGANGSFQSLQSFSATQLEVRVVSAGFQSDRDPVTVVVFR